MKKRWNHVAAVNRPGEWLGERQGLVEHIDRRNGGWKSWPDEQAYRCTEAIQKLDASGSVIHLLVQRSFLSGRSAGQCRNRENPLRASGGLCGHVGISELGQTNLAGVNGRRRERRDGGAITVDHLRYACSPMWQEIFMNRFISL